MTKPRLLLAGDVGGTKTSLGLFSPDGGARRPIAQIRVESAAHDGLAAICRTFLAETDVPVSHAVFGVAGPVIHGGATITNLPWRLDERVLATELALERVVLLNDLAAMTYAIPELAPDESTLVVEGTADAEGAIAVIAPGTGLGMGYATRGAEGFAAHASEGGHAGFAPRGELQEGLLAFLRERHSHVSAERVCSGMGIPNLYAYLAARGVAEEPEWLSQALAAADDPTPVIADAALVADPPSALARRTLELFVDILGAVAGDLALTVLAGGGVYVGGGIAPRMLPLLAEDRFRVAFVSKGRLRGFVETVPVRVICNPEATLLGAAAHGLARLMR